MTPMDEQAIRKFLYANQPRKLFGQPEGQHLEAKSQGYALDKKEQVAELAKDVCAFLNGGGGVLVVGIDTININETEVLRQFCPLGGEVKREQYRDLIHNHIIPSPLKVAVKWSADREGNRVLFLDIPKQEENCVFVLSGALKKNAPWAKSAVVPIRTDDVVRMLDASELQKYISLGMSMAATDLAHSDSGPLRIGYGLADRELEFQRAYHQLAHVGLGTPAGAAQRDGEALLQDFHHARPHKPGWKLCLAPGRPPFAVPLPVWNTLITVGQADPGGNPLAAVGYPKPPRARRDRLLGPWKVTERPWTMSLTGGTWGPGRIRRSWRGNVAWHPESSVPVVQEKRAAGQWTTVQARPPHLRLRALVTLPWADAVSLRVSPVGRRFAQQGLRASRLNGAVSGLLPRQVAPLPWVGWSADCVSDKGRAASFTRNVYAEDGTPVLTSTAMITLPPVFGAAIVSCVDVRIEDADAWLDVIGTKREARLGIEEIEQLLQAAWWTAARLLPAAIAAPADRRWITPPTAELSLSVERPDQRGTLPTLASVMGLSSPTASASRRTEMAVRMTVSPAVRKKQQTSLTRQALQAMADAFGSAKFEMQFN